MKLRALLLSLLLVLPLAVGAGLQAFFGWRADAPAAAPQSAPGTAEAARAASEARAQAEFLETGTGQLKDGTGELVEGAKPLGEGVDSAKKGADDLAAGLTQLQSGTGQLGDGATRIADGVGTAVDNIVGVNAVRGQIIAAIDSTLADLKGNDSADARAIKGQLTDLKAQAQNFELDANLAAQLTELKKGSRDLANQLAVSGYDYHDGVYTATQGAQDLAAGLGELQKGTDKALSGVDELDSGAQRLQTMAEQNSTKIDAVRKAMPAPAAQSAPAVALDPLLAVLLSALTLLGGAGVGVYWAAAARAGARVWHVLLLGTLGLTIAAAAGLALCALPALDGASLAAAAPAVGLAAGVFALATLAGAVATRLLIAATGIGWGLTLAGVGGLAQLLLTGWIWKAGITGAALVVANLFPLAWATSGVVVAVNGGDAALQWIAVGVLAVIVCCGFAVSRAVRPAQTAVATNDE